MVKKTFIRLMLVAAILTIPVLLVLGAMTNSVQTAPTADWWSGATDSGRDNALLWAREVEDLLEGASVFTGFLDFDEISTPASPSANVGRLYIADNAGTTTLYFRDNNDVSSSCIAGSGSVGGNDTYMQYNNASSLGGIAGIIYDDTNMEFQDDIGLAFGTTADWLINYDESVDDQLLFITANTAAGALTDPMYEIIVGAAVTANQEIFGVSYGTQASNTSVLSIDTEGDLIIAGNLVADLTLSSGETITNIVSSEIAFTGDGGENLIFDMDAGTNAVGLKSTTGVDELALGTVDDLTGVGTIVLDAASCSITSTADATDEDFTISQAGGVNASLVLSSAGTPADALQISTSAGGMDLTVAGAASGEDMDLLSNRAINLTSTEATADAIVFDASDGSGGIIFKAGAGISCNSGTDTFGGYLKVVADDAEPHVITAAESGTILTNAGSNGADAWTLPSAITGMHYTFVVMADQEMRITVASGDALNKSGTVAVAAGDYYHANLIGEMLEIVAVDNTNWIVVAETGTWTDSSP